MNIKKGKVSFCCQSFACVFKQRKTGAETIPRPTECQINEGWRFSVVSCHDCLFLSLSLWSLISHFLLTCPHPRSDRCFSCYRCLMSLLCCYWCACPLAWIRNLFIMIFRPKLAPDYALICAQCYRSQFKEIMTGRRESF